MALNYAPDTTDEQLREYQDVVSGQDIPIVESQRPELLPLDLQIRVALAFGSHRHRLPQVADKNRLEVRYRVSAGGRPRRLSLPTPGDGLSRAIWTASSDCSSAASLICC